MDDREHLVLQCPELDPQEIAYHLRRDQRVATTHLAGQHAQGGLQYLVGLGRPVVARDIANEKGGIEGKGKLRHDRAPVRIRRICLELAKHVAAQRSGV